MNSYDKINITGTSMTGLVLAAYNISKAESDAEINQEAAEVIAKDILERLGNDNSEVRIDRFNETAVNLNLFNIDGQHYIADVWEGHTDDELSALLGAIAVEESELNPTVASEAAQRIARVIGNELNSLNVTGNYRESRTVARFTLSVLADVVKSTLGPKALLVAVAKVMTSENNESEYLKIYKHERDSDKLKSNESIH